MELPKRKNNRLPEYDYSSAGAYFITVCTKDRKCLLAEIVGDAALGVPQNRLTKIGTIVQKYIHSGNNMELVTVDKYVIMPNHIHLILFVEACVGVVASDDPSTQAQKMEKTENPPVGVGFSDGTPRAASPTKAVIPRFVAALKRFTNKEVGENIFQRSYHDHIIRNEKDYLRIWEYMENNPKQWELDCFYVRENECI